MSISIEDEDLDETYCGVCFVPWPDCTCDSSEESEVDDGDEGESSRDSLIRPDR